MWEFLLKCELAHIKTGVSTMRISHSIVDMFQCHSTRSASQWKYKFRAFQKRYAKRYQIYVYEQDLFAYCAANAWSNLQHAAEKYVYISEA